MIRASSGAKSAATYPGRLSAMYFSSRSSPAPLDGGEVELERGEVGRERNQLHVEVRGLLGPGTDQALRPLQLHVLEVADGEVDGLLRPILRCSGRHEDRVVVRSRAVHVRVVDVDVVDPSRGLRREDLRYRQVLLR